MSIWVNAADHIGTDPTDWRDARTGKPVRKKAQGGNVLSYAEGFSNHFPDTTGNHERPAAVALASIPVWCVPGHRDDEYDEKTVGPWLRLEVAAPETLNHWVKSGAGQPVAEERHATVVMDESAARSLVAQLNEWLDRPKARPKKARRRQEDRP